MDPRKCRRYRRNVYVCLRNGRSGVITSYSIHYTKLYEASGTSLKEYESQLKTTKMFYNASEAEKFTENAALITTMNHVSKFSFENGLLGNKAKDAGYIGMEFPGHKTLVITSYSIHYTKLYERILNLARP